MRNFVSIITLPNILSWSGIYHKFKKKTLILRVENDNQEPSTNYHANMLQYPRELDYNDLISCAKMCKNPECDIGTDLYNFMKNNYVCENGIGKYRISEYIFGCKKISDLHQWFSLNNLGYLIANGFNIYLYDVNDEHVVLGSNQLCFNKNYVNSKKVLTLRKLRKFNK